MPNQVISGVFSIYSDSGIWLIEHGLTVIMGGFRGGQRGPPTTLPPVVFFTEFVLFVKISQKNKMVSVYIYLASAPPSPASEHADAEVIKFQLARNCSFLGECY